jgi:hypothetical protein
MNLAKYSMGIGDRFGRQGRAQLSAFVAAAEAGIAVSPVWNKSYREHRLIGTSPSDARVEADQAVRALGWKGAYYVDADHVGLATVEPFIEPCDFFTIDVADFIGKAADAKDISAFARRMSRYQGEIAVPGLAAKLRTAREEIEKIAVRYLLAAREAGKVYRRVAEAKGADNFITEVSMDETETPQSPLELFFILAALAEEGVRASTVAPKFPGRFNKGVDYMGDVALFEEEFDRLVCVAAFAAKEFGLPRDLKLSVHSGSDKFSLYAPISRVVAKRKAGFHLKTAGTTWLEEIIGLAKAGGEGLALAKELYAQAYPRFDELVAPYATVVDIDRAALPLPAELARWDGQHLALAVRHAAGFDRNLRQFFHISFKVAGEMGKRYLEALDRHEDVIAGEVRTNILDRHIRPLFSALREGKSL